MALSHGRHCRDGVPRQGWDDGLVEKSQSLVFRTDELVSAADGELLCGAADREFGDFSIDSRQIQRGELFLAVKGERFDGHEFVADAVRKGAAGVIVSDPSAVASKIMDKRDVTVVIVEDTTRSLQTIARHVRRRSCTTVVAITGSIGKTTTKELSAAFIGVQKRVYRNIGNLNNHIGLPLSLLKLRHQPEVAVVELGMNHAGEIRTLVDIAEPNVRVWTNVAEVHAENFSSIEDIADAKAELLEGSRSNDRLVANADDSLVMNRVSQFPGPMMTFGLEKTADVRAIAVNDSGIDGISATIETPEGSGLLQIPLIGMGNVANVLASIAVALQFQIPLEAMRDVLTKFIPPDRRGFVTHLSHGVTIVDDSYNSNPTALQRALESIGRTTGYRRRIAILGEMLELGIRSKALHYLCGKKAVEAGFECIVAVGDENATALGAGSCDAGLDSGSVIICSTSQEAIKIVSELIQKEDLVFVKGSRGLQTDLVVERLKADWS